MAITATLTRRSIMASKARLLLTVVAVVLGVAFVSGSFILRDSLKDVFTDLFTEINEGIDASVRTEVGFGTPGTGNPVPAELLDTVRGVDGVVAADGAILQSGVTIVGADGKAETPTGAPTLGVSWGEDPVLSPLQLTEGTKPAGDGEVALDEKAASKAGYDVGDTVTLVLPEGKRTFTLSAVFRFGESNSLAGAYLVGFDPAVAPALLGLDGGYTTIDVRAAEGISPEELVTRLERVLPDGYEAVDNETLNDEATDQVSDIVDGFALALLVFAAIALFVSAFIINNTFAIIAHQRIRELAMLRAVGASAGQIRTIMAAEALIVGVVASILGIGVGAVVALSLKALISAFAGDLPGGLVFGPTSIVAGLVTGIVVTFASALAPAIRAGQIPPVAAMSGAYSFTIGNARRRLVFAGTAAVLGGALLVWSLFGRPGATGTYLSLAGVGAVLLFLGVAGLSRLVVRPMVLGIGRGLERVTRLGGRIVRPRGDHPRIVAQLSRENAARQPRRTSASAAALMIGLAFVSLGAVVGASIKETFREQLSTSITADLFITDESFTGIGQDLIDHVAELPGVGEVSGLRQASFRIDGDTKSVAAVDAATFASLVDVDLKEGSWDDLGPGAVFIGTDPADDLGLAVGEQVQAEFPSTGAQTLTVAGIYDDQSVVGNWLIDTSTYDANYTGTPLALFAAATIAPGADLETVKNEVVSYTLDNAPNIDVQDKEEFRKSQEQQINIILAVINVLLGLAVVIALIGIANTLALSVYERTHELGLLRAVGMTRTQTKRSVRWESVLVAVFGALLGVVVGVALGILVSLALPSSVVDTVAFPVVQLAAYVLFSIVAGVMAARKPAKRAAKMNVLEAIATV